MTVVKIDKDLVSVYERMKSTREMEAPIERLLGAVILRAIMDYFNPKYRAEVERFFQNGLGSWMDVDWMKTISTIGGRS